MKFYICIQAFGLFSEGSLIAVSKLRNPPSASPHAPWDEFWEEFDFTEVMP